MFDNRNQAGQLLWEKLKEKEINISDYLILAILPKGLEVVGGFLGENIIKTIKIKKIIDKNGKVIGACGKNKSSIFLHKSMIQELEISNEELENCIKNVQSKILGQEQINFENKKVIIVDDGVNTGERIISACRQVWAQEPKRVVVAVPVCSRDSYQKIEKECDSLICVSVEDYFYRVSQFYRE